MSVCAGDDCDEHQRQFNLPGSDSLEKLLAAIIKSNYLPTISGGCATWSVTSAIPIAVIAQQWTEPRMLFLLPKDLAKLERKEGILRLHFNYHAQIDPEIVLTVLRELRLHAI
jgi:hypothetical protein